MRIGLDEGLFAVHGSSGGISAEFDLLKTFGSVVIPVAPQGVHVSGRKMDGWGYISVVDRDEPLSASGGMLDRSAVVHVRSESPIVISNAINYEGERELLAAGEYVLAFAESDPGAFEVGVWRGPFAPELLTEIRGSSVNEIDEAMRKWTEKEAKRDRLKTAMQPLYDFVTTDSRSFSDNDQVVVNARVVASKQSVQYMWKRLRGWLHRGSHFAELDGHQVVVCEDGYMTTVGTILRPLSTPGGGAVAYEVRWTQAEEVVDYNHDPFLSLTPATHLTVTFAERGGETEYTITHSGLPHTWLTAVEQYWTTRTEHLEYFAQQRDKHAKPRRKAT